MTYEKKYSKSLKFLKDFIFYKYIYKMYLLADIKINCGKSRFIQEQKRLLTKLFKTKNCILNEKDFIFHKYICKMYKL